MIWVGIQDKTEKVKHRYTEVNKKMKKILSPKEAYRMVQKIAEKHKMSVSSWAEKCGVRKSTVSHWRCRKQKTVLLSTLERLGIKI